MKSNYLILLHVFISFGLYGQYKSIFGTKSTHWDVILNGYCDAIYTTHLEVLSDTFFNGKQYHKIHSTSDYTMSYEFLREDTFTGKVWHYNKSMKRELLVMDLSLNVGDSFLIYNYRDSFELFVDSIYIKNELKHIHFSSCYINLCKPLKNPFEFVEGTGSNGGIYFTAWDNVNITSYLLCHHKNGEKVFGNSDFNNVCDVKIVSVQDIPKSNDFQVFPNPTTSNIFLHINTEVMEPYKFSIYTSTGICLSSQEIFAKDSKISIENTTPGLYYYILSNTVQRVYTGKFIKK